MANQQVTLFHIKNQAACPKDLLDRAMHVVWVHIMCLNVAVTREGGSYLGFLSLI